MTTAPAYAWAPLGTKWAKDSSTWPQYRAYLDYHTLPDSWRDRCDNARMEWNDKGASKLYYYYSDASGSNVIQADGLSGGALANTSTYAYAGTSTTQKIIVKVNTNYSWYASGTFYPWQFDLESVLVHEFGHGVGLADLYALLDITKSMYAYDFGCYETWPRSLHSDDIAGIRALYGSK